MNAAQFSSALGKVNDKYIMETVTYEHKKKKVWLKWMAMAACVCVLAIFIDLPSLEKPQIDNGGGNSSSFFNGIVLEVTNDTVSVECVNGLDSDFVKGDIISFSTSIVAGKGLPNITPGDTVRVIYNDTTVEEDPFKIGIVFNVYLIDDNGNILPN